MVSKVDSLEFWSPCNNLSVFLNFWKGLGGLNFTCFLFSEPIIVVGFLGYLNVHSRKLRLEMEEQQKEKKRLEASPTSLVDDFWRV